jgi:hypothetical protein
MFKLLFIFGTLAIYGIVGAKVFPLYSNHFKIKKAVHSVASEGTTDPIEVRKALERRWMVDDMSIIEPTDIKVKRGDRGKVSLVYDYEARAHLFYNADISLVFTGSEPVSGAE